MASPSTCTDARYILATSCSLRRDVSTAKHNDRRGAAAGRCRRIQREMPMRYRSSICAVALAAALLATPSAAQVVDFGKYPDFKGQWVRTGNPNNWRELAGPAPLTPEYQKILDDIQAALTSDGHGNW